MGLKRKIWALLAAMCMVAASAPPCAAMTAPAPSMVASWEEFLTRCRGEDETGALREYYAPQPLICRESAVLDKTADRVDLVAFAGIRVSSGAVLTIDNPNLVPMGLPPVITVEAGGTLRILRWNALTLEAMPLGGIVVETGGKLEVPSQISLPDGLVQDHNPAPEPEPEPAPEPAPEPEPAPAPEPAPEPEPPGPPPALECTQWQIRPSGITNLWLQTEPCGLTEETTTAIYLYRSTDGQDWQLQGTLVWQEDHDGFATAEEPYYPGWIKDGKVKVAYFEPTGEDTLYFYIEAVGPDRTVISRPYRFVPPGTPPPAPANGGTDGETISGGPGDGDGNSGNRGGTQGEFDRTGQQTQEDDQADQKGPAPTENPAPTDPPGPSPTQEPAVSGGGLSHISGGQVSTGSGAQSGSTGCYTGYSAQADSTDIRPQEEKYTADRENAPLENERPAVGPVEADPEGSAPAPPPETEAPEELDEKLDAASGPETTTSPTVPGDGDRGPVAAVATVSACALAGAVLLLHRHIQRRRKS